MFSDEALDIVLSYPKLEERLKSRPEDRAKVKKMFKEIHGDFSPTVVQSASKIIDATFLKLYDGVNLEVAPGMDFAELQKKYHIVLVPNHQSHADYVALTYSMFKKFGVAIRVAAGINLNVFPMGQLFGKAGAFFIRRTFSTDQLYKITFEAYVYHLLKTDSVVEFFFEGGRTRTGKLLKPKYGLFQMLLEGHSQIKDSKPLLFIPVSLAHEHIPEEKAHARELGGAKKKAESGAQLFKLFKLFNKRLGTIHIHFGEGIVCAGYTGELKEATQKLAFECFTAVGRGMPITPSSLLALVMLDEPSGALTWKQIEERALDVVEYCRAMEIPLTPSLKDDLENSVRSALDMFIGNKKIDVLKREKLNQVFYAIKSERRVEVLYHKNMILHHFLVAGIINATWFNVFNGAIKDGMALTRFLTTKRKELKYEFYLPSVKEMIREALHIISFALGRKVESLEECMKLSSQELYLLATKVRRFSTALSYLYEAYYISAVTVKYLASESFTQERFVQVAKELFSMEIEHGRIVKYPESFAVPIIKETLDYHLNQKVLERNEDRSYKVTDIPKLDLLIEKFIRDLNDQVAINLKFNKALP